MTTTAKPRPKETTKDLVGGQGGVESQAGDSSPAAAEVRGAGSLVAALTAASDPDELQGQLYGVLLYAIPESPDATIDFIRMVTAPEGDSAIPKKAPENVKQAAQAARAELWEKLENPELEDVLSIIEAITQREKTDIMALGKRLIAAIKAATAKNLDTSRI